MLTVIIVSLFSGIFAYLLCARIWGQLDALNVRRSIFLKLPGKSLSVRQRIKEFDDILSAGINSKESIRIKLLLSCAVFVVSLLCIGLILFAMTFACLAFWGINYAYSVRHRRVEELFDAQLSEALAMITNSVKTGQSMMQALEYAQTQLKPPISMEFEFVLAKIRLGIPMELALRELAQGKNNKDLNMAVNAITVASETGGNIGDILASISKTISEKRNLARKVKALTAQGKASGIIMSAVPVFLLIVLYLMEPAMTGLLFTTTMGNVMLILVILMISLGAFFSGKILDIDI